MTKQEHAAKLRLIANIIENDLPFEVSRVGMQFAEPINRAGYYSDLDSVTIRIKPEPAPPVLIDLECKDVPPGSELTQGGLNPGVSWTRLSCVGSGVIIAEKDGISEKDGSRVYLRHLPFSELKTGKWTIKRPGEDWQPCSKPQA